MRPKSVHRGCELQVRVSPSELVVRCLAGPRKSEVAPSHLPCESLVSEWSPAGPRAFEWQILERGLASLGFSLGQYTSFCFWQVEPGRCWFAVERAVASVNSSRIRTPLMFCTDLVVPIEDVRQRHRRHLVVELVRLSVCVSAVVLGGVGRVME